jgi:hypothetical protein
MLGKVKIAKFASKNKRPPNSFDDLFSWLCLPAGSPAEGGQAGF